jgi:BirA family biotin operon repressor/biotin-[acetyl-CoA-carboxylase] ligase
MQLVHLDTVDSTNDYLKRELKAGRLAAPVAVCADAQSAGRGRFSRAWESPQGGLYLSVALPAPEGAGPALGQVALLVALAAYRVLAREQADLAIKWPNDILRAGRKFVGILVEVQTDTLICGIGVNAREEGWAVALSREVEESVGQWQRAGFSFAPFRAEYERHLSLLGTAVEVHDLAGALRAQGECVGVDAQGRLLVRQNGRITAVVSGEATLGSPR